LIESAEIKMVMNLRTMTTRNRRDKRLLKLSLLWDGPSHRVEAER